MFSAGLPAYLLISEYGWADKPSGPFLWQPAFRPTRVVAIIADGVPMRIEHSNSDFFGPNSFLPGRLEESPGRLEESPGLTRQEKGQRWPADRMAADFEARKFLRKPLFSSIRTSDFRRMSHERIESLEDPRLDVFRSLKAQNMARDQRLFIAEGPTVVERVLQSGFEVRSLLISDRKFASFEGRLPSDIPVYRMRAELADTLVGFHFHCGVMACAVKRTTPPPEMWVPKTGPALVLAGDRIVDPENVGALIRIAAAFGAVAVIFGKGSADAFSRRVLRVSMGNVLFLPIVETDDLPGCLRELNIQHQFKTCSTVLDHAAVPLSDFHFPERTVLLMGNEYDGVSAEAIAEASHRMTIPMLNGTDSLNVAVSSGIFLHQYRCQHPIV
ncbi:MAG: RNA methyltransferase [Planctomycetota bacterium]|nr:MAG: RNA methyltransferase [Planctomycetota bacterium]